MKNTKILIVDDKESNLAVLEKILKVFDVELVKAYSGNEALEAMTEYEFAVVLMDVQMPDMDAFEAVRIIRGDQSLESTPVIFISENYRDETHSLKGIESGAVDFILKPIIPEILIGKVRIFIKLYEDKKCLQREIFINNTISKMTNNLILPKLKIDELAEEILYISKKLTDSAEAFISEIKIKDKSFICHGRTSKFAEKNIDVNTYKYIKGLKSFTITQNYLEDENLSKLEQNTKGFSNFLFIPILYNKSLVGQIVVADSIHKYTNSDVEIVNKIATIYALAINRIREEHELLKMEENLKQADKMQAVGQLVGGIAHDFNNVLCGIIGAGQLLQSPKRGLDEKGKKYVDIILKASNRAAGLIDKLMIFSRKGKAELTAIDINDLLDETVELLKRTLDKKIIISENRSANITTVYGNSSELENAFINICINAGHSMPNGGEITISTENLHLNENYCLKSSFDIFPGNYLKIDIMDSGVGIKKENLNKIFEPFFTTKMDYHGTGLGLSVVYGIIKSLNGEIYVESKLGIETIFTLLLPCSSNIVKKDINKDQSLAGHGTILFVDDEDINRTLGEQLLQSLGYNVILAEDGIEALKIYKERVTEVDLVLMDMMMPKMNGAEAFYKMKNFNSSCRVVILSGYYNEKIINEMRKSGLLGVLQKPYLISDLSRIVKSNIG